MENKLKTIDLTVAQTATYFRNCEFFMSLEDKKQLEDLEVALKGSPTRRKGFISKATSKVNL